MPAIATLWTIGTMVLVGQELNIVTSLAPPFVLILGSAFSGHVLNAYVAPLRRGSVHGRVASGCVVAVKRKTGGIGPACVICRIAWST